jgi:uncharacterized protein
MDSLLSQIKKLADLDMQSNVEMAIDTDLAPSVAAGDPYGLDLTHYKNLYDTFDKAHSRQHMDTVLNASKELAGKYAPNQIDLAALAAILHDVGISRGREQHEEFGGQIVSEDDKIRQAIGDKNFRILINAIKEHRASTGNPTSTVGKIVSDADRTSYTSPGSALARAIAFRDEYHPVMSRQDAILSALRHLSKKYAPEGPGRRTYYPETAKKLDEVFNPIIDMHQRGDWQAAEKIVREYNPKAFRSTSEPRYEISGAILGVFKHPDKFPLEVEEEFPDDPWQASVKTTRPLSKEEFRKLFEDYSGDPDGKGTPYYLKIKDKVTGKEYVTFTGKHHGHYGRLFNYDEAKEFGRKLGIPEEQLDFEKKAHGPGEAIGNQVGGTRVTMNDFLEATKDLPIQEIDPKQWEWLLDKKIWGGKRTLSPRQVWEYIQTGDTKGYDKEQLERDAKQMQDADLSFPVLIAENKKHMHDGAHRMYKALLTGEPLMGKYVPDSIWQELKMKSIQKQELLASMSLEDKRAILTKIKALVEQYPEFLVVLPGASISRVKDSGIFKDLREALKNYETSIGEDPNHDWSKTSALKNMGYFKHLMANLNVAGKSLKSEGTLPHRLHDMLMHALHGVIPIEATHHKIP